ncbi:DUF2487 family protein [Paenibacillus abyssi]|uniref:DUF2487 domain-containing protein n=1 Tax=Paenibacillus abyssi TaxID=1340531 RepID=A0A917CIP8_9BACL|nr:DUF2487 family protein [Paenibacillus abyssi]GGF88936.1 hypothetical protein GCM10010916_02800 [Paenibacillus abyssi]
MKFNEIEEGKWTELQPYLDTCLLPVTGITGYETPHEVTGSLEQLRDIMDLIELPFKGRVVTYPAFHYYEAGNSASIEHVCRQLKLQGFRYVVLITAKTGMELEVASADLLIQPEADGSLPASSDIKHAIQSLWQRASNAEVGEKQEIK